MCEDPWSPATAQWMVPRGRYSTSPTCVGTQRKQRDTDVIKQELLVLCNCCCHTCRYYSWRSISDEHLCIALCCRAKEHLPAQVMCYASSRMARSCLVC
jgi:hypothetical protein